MSRRPRRVSSATYAVLSLDARAGMWASAERAGALLEALLGMGVQLVPGHEDHVRELLRVRLREAYLAGGEREADLETTIAIQAETVARLRGMLRARGIEPPRRLLPPRGRGGEGGED